ncbi:ThuA domain-containing protein [Sphaerimonospora mesophila]|uniref:ThuA domain-containing protein n=1 Tax=Sphaerimonospora mesophila TaxID=37483 RepID=UPI0006E1A272
MVRNLILSGGVAHDFPATSAALAEVLAEVGVRSEITEDVAGALAEPPEVELITVNAFRWRMDGHDFADQRDRWRFETPPAARTALLDHLDRGGGLLCVHTASLCFDDWPEWVEILGGAWRWGRSYHPPIGPAAVEIGTGHPIVDGLPDFEVIDEVYTDLDVVPGVEPLATAHGQPMLWARAVRHGRVAYDALGHDLRSYENPVHRELIRRTARWLVDRVDRTG